MRKVILSILGVLAISSCGGEADPKPDPLHGDWVIGDSEMLVLSDRTGIARFVEGVPLSFWELTAEDEVGGDTFLVTWVCSVDCAGVQDAAWSCRAVGETTLSCICLHGGVNNELAGVAVEWTRSN